jgi:hypothetical protein
MRLSRTAAISITIPIARNRLVRTGIVPLAGYAGLSTVGPVVSPRAFDARLSKRHLSRHG